MALMDALVEGFIRRTSGSDVPEIAEMIDKTVDAATIPGCHCRGHGRGFQELSEDVVGCDVPGLAAEETQHVCYSHFSTLGQAGIGVIESVADITVVFWPEAGIGTYVDLFAFWQAIIHDCYLL